MTCPRGAACWLRRATGARPPGRRNFPLEPARRGGVRQQKGRPGASPRAPGKVGARGRRQSSSPPGRAGLPGRAPPPGPQPRAAYRRVWPRPAGSRCHPRAPAPTPASLGLSAGLRGERGQVTRHLAGTQAPTPTRRARLQRPTLRPPAANALASSSVHYRARRESAAKRSRGPRGPARRARAASTGRRLHSRVPPQEPGLRGQWSQGALSCMALPACLRPDGLAPEPSRPE